MDKMKPDYCHQCHQRQASVSAAQGDMIFKTKKAIRNGRPSYKESALKAKDFYMDARKYLAEHTATHEDVDA